MKRSLLPPAAALPLPLLVITVATAPWLLWWHDLPPDLATQWNLLGQATNPTARPLALFLSAGLATLLALASLTYATYRTRHDRAGGNAADDNAPDPASQPADNHGTSCANSDAGPANGASLAARPPTATAPAGPAAMQGCGSPGPHPRGLGRRWR